MHFTKYTDPTLQQKQNITEPYTKIPFTTRCHLKWNVMWVMLQII